MILSIDLMLLLVVFWSCSCLLSRGSRMVTEIVDDEAHSQAGDVRCLWPLTYSRCVLSFPDEPKYPRHALQFQSRPRLSNVHLDTDSHVSSKVQWPWPLLLSPLSKLSKVSGILFERFRAYTPRSRKFDWVPAVSCWDRGSLVMVRTPDA